MGLTPLVCRTNAGPSRLATWIGDGVTFRLLLAVAFASSFLAACGGGGTTIMGVFTLEDRDGFEGEWDECEGEGGYSDFHARANFRNPPSPCVGWSNIDVSLNVTVRGNGSWETW